LAEAGFLEKDGGVTFHDKVRNCRNHKSLTVE